MSLESALSKTRLVFRDYGESFQAQVAGDGESVRFDLPVTNIDTTTLTVYIRMDGVVSMLLPSATTEPAAGEYALEERSGVITLGTAPPVGTTLVVEGIGSLFSTPLDMTDFLEIAMDLHTKGRIPELTWENVTPAEEYAIVLLAVREALWAEIAEAAHQVDVSTPEGMHIPGGQHFQQLMAMLDRIEAHYKEFAQALNVGPWAIQMFTLRRISRTTNRLVPLYVPQEFDDRTPPVRVHPPIGGGLT